MVDRLKPNQYPGPLKVKWLSNLDGQIFREVVMTHEDAAIDSFEGYDHNTSVDTELLVDDPFCHDIYNYYLQAQIDKENGEILKYNQSITMYNSAFLAYQNWYNVNHMPIHAGRRFLF
jgi:hypothetical protein